VNTPLIPEPPNSTKVQRRLEEPVPDPNGLGWPGERPLSRPAMLIYAFNSDSKIYPLTPQCDPRRATGPRA
jgi:hypothetical protein